MFWFDLYGNFMFEDFTYENSEESFMQDVSWKIYCFRIFNSKRYSSGDEEIRLV